MTLEKGKHYGQESLQQTLQDKARTRLNNPTPHQVRLRQACRTVHLLRLPPAPGHAPYQDALLECTGGGRFNGHRNCVARYRNQRTTAPGKGAAPPPPPLPFAPTTWQPSARSDGTPPTTHLFEGARVPSSAPRPSRLGPHPNGLFGAYIELTPSQHPPDQPQAPQRERVSRAQVPGHRSSPSRQRRGSSSARGGGGAGGAAGAAGGDGGGGSGRSWKSLIRPDVNMGVPTLMMILEPNVVWEHTQVRARVAGVLGWGWG